MFMRFKIYINSPLYHVNKCIGYSSYRCIDCVFGVWNILIRIKSRNAENCDKNEMFYDAIEQEGVQKV